MGFIKKLWKKITNENNENYENFQPKKIDGSVTGVCWLCCSLNLYFMFFASFYDHVVLSFWPTGKVAAWENLKYSLMSSNAGLVRTEFG